MVVMWKRTSNQQMSGTVIYMLVKYNPESLFYKGRI